MKKDCKVCGSARRSKQHRMLCLKGTKFTWIVKRSCATTLRLPSRFGKNVAEFLQEGAILYANETDVTRVEVAHRSGGYNFGDGWSRFYEKYKILKGSVLLFKYLGYSSFKVDIFNARSGLVVDEPAAVDAGPVEGEAARVPRPVGRPRVEYQESAEFGEVRLYGMKLRQFTKFNLRAELRRRRITEEGCKGELLEKLGRFIMNYGPDFHYERIRFGEDWRWV